MRRLLLPLLAVAAACTVRPMVTRPAAANAPAAMPIAVPPQATNDPKAKPVEVAAKAADLIDHLGDSTATAVPVPKDAPNEGADFQNNWIFDHFGRFRRDKWAIAQAEGRHYKVLTIELADHTYRTVYFDITESWDAWKPTTPQ
ncbi:MAG: hypothetical protein JWO97_3105 [Acidobacteria bacterium]|nr:hypothetical protein [Acidobacteriota bacterium]